VLCKSRQHGVFIYRSSEYSRPQIASADGQEGAQAGRVAWHMHRTTLGRAGRVARQSKGKNPDVPYFLVAASLFPCLTHIATALPQGSRLEQAEHFVVMLTKVLFEKEQMLNEKKMSGAVDAQSMCCRCAVGARGGAAGWPASRWQRKDR